MALHFDGHLLSAAIVGLFHGQVGPVALRVGSSTVNAISSGPSGETNMTSTITGSAAVALRAASSSRRRVRFLLIIYFSAVPIASAVFAASRGRE